MKNSFGQAITLTIFGESHGPAVGCVLDGLSPGMRVDSERIREELAKRRPSSELDTPRREQDEFEILSGVYEGCTTGTPLAIVIPNRDTKSSDYVYGPARPSHADYTAFLRYGGFEDPRGGGHFSGRVTASLVAAAGILLPALEKRGITIETTVKSCHGKASSEMETEIRRAREDCDSVGGITETVVRGFPGGIGEPWFDSVEGLLSHAVFSLGGVKGIEFGEGFHIASMYGSEANDAFSLRDGKIVTDTNHSGGIQGGITNGEDIVFRTAVKPTPSIGKPQKTVDFMTNGETELAIKGRHDPAIVRRICPVITAVTALVLADLLAVRFGTEIFSPEGDRR